MLYLIGGPPRCGKSELALRLCRARGVPFVSTDALWGVLEEAIPAWRTPMAKGAHRILDAGGLFEPYLARCVGLLQDSGPDFAVEGELILPAEIPSLAASYPIRSVFLIRSRVSVDELVNPPGRNAWLSGAPPAHLDAVADEVMSHSSFVARACAELALPCVDVAAVTDGFDAALGQAQELLGLE